MSGTPQTEPDTIIAQAGEAVDAVAYFAHILGLKAAQSQRGRWALYAVDVMQLTTAVHVIGELVVADLEKEGVATV